MEVFKINSVNTSDECKEAVFNKIYDWFCENELFNGESVAQSDVSLLELPDLVADIVDMMEFDITWEDE